MNRVILIGNGSYENEKYPTLKSVYRDIETMEDIFLNLEYEVTKHIDLSYDEIKKELAKYKKTISDTDNIVVYYSGHGFYKNGRNFILVKDSPILPNAKLDSEYYESFKFCNVEVFTQLAENNLNGNTLVIIDACRTEGSIEFEPLKESLTKSNTVWQLFSTSLGESAFANGLFVEAIERVIYRNKQSVTEFFQSICCYMDNNYNKEKREYQAPILISGKNNFYIVNELNQKVEQIYFDDVLNIYSEVIKVIGAYEYPYTEEVITQIATDVNSSYYYPIDKMKELIRKVSHYFGELGIIDLLIDENVKEIDVFADRFWVQGMCSNYYFPNENIYDYDTCWEHIRSNSDKTETFQYKYGKITCLNFEPCTTEKVFSLIINQNRESLSYYIEEYYRNDYSEIKRLRILLRDIFINQKSIFIAGSRFITKLPFIHSLLCEYLQHFPKICEFTHLTQIDETPFPIEKIEFMQLFKDSKIEHELLEKINHKEYDWIIIPLTAYLDSSLNKTEMTKLLEIETVAKQNQISLIFYTDFLKDAVPSMHITKQALPFVEYVIYLEQNENNEHTYIESIKSIEEI